MFEFLGGLGHMDVPFVTWPKHGTLWICMDCWKTKSDFMEQLLLPACLCLWNEDSVLHLLPNNRIFKAFSSFRSQRHTSTKPVSCCAWALNIDYRVGEGVCVKQTDLLVCNNSCWTWTELFLQLVLDFWFLHAVCLWSLAGICRNKKPSCTAWMVLSALPPGWLEASAFL